MDQQQASFKGWAMVELFGHAREIGYVESEYFGGTALFRVDVPEMPARETTLVRPEWIDGKLAPVGTVVRREAVAGRTRYVGPGAVYALNPCDEQAARSALEKLNRAEIAIVSLPEGKQLQASLPGEEEGEGYEDEDTYDDRH